MDPKLARVIDVVGEMETMTSDTDIYGALMSAIIGQQISTAAARSIRAKFLFYFNNKYPDAETVISTTEETFKSLGLSTQKAGYIKNVAFFYKENNLKDTELMRLDDETLVTKLTQIKGVGRWTVEMMLMFKLARPDIFALDDLGLVSGVMAIYSLKKTKTLKKRIDKITKLWSPYRSLASRYVWAYRDSL